MMPGLVMTTDHDDMMIASNDVFFVRLFGFGFGAFLFHHTKVEYTRLYSAKTNKSTELCYLNQHRIYNCIVSEYSPRPPFPFPRISAG